MDVAVAVSDLYSLPKAEYAPISHAAQRDLRHTAAKQPAASASPLPDQAKSPSSAAADMTNAPAPAGDDAGAVGDSNERHNSTGHASSTARQVGHALLLCTL